MERIVHRLFGEGTVVAREQKGQDCCLTVRFESSGREMRILLPDSFETGLMRAEGALNEEVNAAILARRERERLAREEKAAAREREALKARRHSYGSRGTGDWLSIVCNADIAARDDYEAYLIREEYTEKTESGAESTVPQYVRAVELVLAEERLTWSALGAHISQLLLRYERGGACETVGELRHRTVINALKRYAESLSA